jgi:hypothetical protein
MADSLIPFYEVIPIFYMTSLTTIFVANGQISCNESKKNKEVNNFDNWVFYKWAGMRWINFAG